MRDAFRHFLDGSKRLTEAYGLVKDIRPPLPLEFVNLLDGAITDLIEARQALQDAAQGTAFAIDQGGIK